MFWSSSFSSEGKSQNVLPKSQKLSIYIFSFHVRGNKNLLFFHFGLEKQKQKMKPLFFSIVVCLNVCGPHQLHKTGQGLGLVHWWDHPPGRRHTWDTILQGRRKDGHDWAGKAFQYKFPVSWHTSHWADDRSYSWNLSASMTSLLYSCNTKNKDIHTLFIFL